MRARRPKNCNNFIKPVSIKTKKGESQFIPTSVEFPSFSLSGPYIDPLNVQINLPDSPNQNSANLLVFVEQLRILTLI